MATSVPPHNLAELCDAALHLIANPAATADALAEWVLGPDFPTGGIIVEPKSAIVEAYRTGRGAFRVRARWTTEDQGKGTWVAVVTEIPYGVQKSRLIEKLAELINDKKLPLVADLRDESTEFVRVVIEPRARTVSPAMLMESLFRLSELEVRVPLNMNVLVDGVVPRVVGLPEALKQWIDHRRTVLIRQSRHRRAAVEHRLEVLAGMIIAYLNLDEVIRIIREEDEPKDTLIARFTLTEVQANYILDTRLRSLRRLEEMQLRAEHDNLVKEREGIDALLGDETAQWRSVTKQIRDLRKKYGPDTPLGKRRTSFEDMPEIQATALNEALVEREPVTVLVSAKGWIRAMKGHVADLGAVTFKGDDTLRFSFFTESTARILVLASDGKVFTLEAAKLPGGRGTGEPIRLLADLEEAEEIVAVRPYEPGTDLLVVASDARGFVVSQDDAVGGTRKGKALMTLDAPVKLQLAVAAKGDHVATVGENRKLLVFPLAQVPRMARGKGMRLQRYKDGGLSDAKVFTLADGLTWKDTSGRTWTVSPDELRDWLGNRAEAGRLPPKGFPKSNRFAGRGADRTLLPSC